MFDVSKLITLATIYCLTFGSVCQCAAREDDDAHLSEVLHVLRQGGENTSGPQLDHPWWQSRISESIDSNASRVDVGVNELLRLAIANSAKVSVARHVPLIRETAVKEAVAAFDWNRYAETMWADTSDPVGSSLTVGGGGTRYLDENWTLNAGARRRLTTGASVDLSQQLGHQDSNSSFFIPDNQATSRIVLGFTQPLLRGRGKYYNTSLILLANIDVNTASQEFSRQLQTHLLEVARGYWSLYLERAHLAQKLRLYLRTKKIYDQIEIRQKIDAQRTQLVSARAALESRESELIRVVAAVKNSETRLRALINAPELAGDPSTIELIPVDNPIVTAIPTDLQLEFATAMNNRPELKAAFNSIKAACVRLDMSTNEVLPQLNLVTQTYVAGLRGNSDFGDAWLDQFDTGQPSYSVGLQYEVAFGRQAAFARKSRREIELSQMREEYRNTLELVRAEVEVAVREVKTAYAELFAKHRAWQAAELEAETYETRWREQIDVVSAGLSLEALLRAQERVSATEFEFATAQLTYNLALINLRNANGTLLTILQGTGSMDEPQAIGEVNEDFQPLDHVAPQQQFNPGPDDVSPIEYPLGADSDD